MIFHSYSWTCPYPCFTHVASPDPEGVAWDRDMHTRRMHPGVEFDPEDLTLRNHVTEE